MPAPILKGGLEEWRKATIHEELNADICKLLSELDAVDKTLKVSSSRKFPTGK
ncbi:unnamed protein product [Calypogeia fissa]